MVFVKKKNKNVDIIVNAYEMQCRNANHVTMMCGAVTAVNK
jgi:hypothetical protein